MLRCIRGTAAALVAAVLFALVCHAAPPLSASCAILMDADTGEIVFEQNADTRSLIASTTKIMTAVVVLEHCDPDMEFTVPPQATGIEGSSIYLQPGERLTIRALLYGMMLHSGNDAAVALALACSGSVDEFVAVMNVTAQKLGMQNTHFENPNGLDGKTHYSTARDLAVLTKYALKSEEFIQITSTKSIEVGNRCLTNHNRLLWSVEGAIGVKTGYTRAAGRILVSAAERQGRRLIAVTINDGNDWRDHAALYDFGFARYQVKSLFRNGAPAARMTLLDGSVTTLLAGEDLDWAMAQGDEVRVAVLYPQVAFSAGEARTPAGTAAIYLGERKIAQIRLLWGGNDDAVTKDIVSARGCLTPRR